MDNLRKIIFEISDSEIVRSLANQCKTEKQLLKLILNIKISKALKLRKEKIWLVNLQLSQDRLQTGWAI